MVTASTRPDPFITSIPDETHLSLSKFFLFGYLNQQTPNQSKHYKFNTAYCILSHSIYRIQSIRYRTFSSPPCTFFFASSPDEGAGMPDGRWKLIVNKIE